MLWSDRPQEPSPEMRRAQVMLRRAGILLTLAIVVLMVLVGR